MTVLTNNAINLYRWALTGALTRPLHSGKWRVTCPSWVYISGAYEAYI